MPIVTSPMDSKPCRPCSIRCQGVSGLIPTLQCRLCLCLYHTECVGLGSHSEISQGYMCKNCQLENQDKTNVTSGHTPTIAPPPLTPISSLKSNNLQLATPPKLQRIPRPGEKVPPPIQSHSKPSIIPTISNISKIQQDPSKPIRANKFSTVPRYVKVPETHNLLSHTEPTKSIVGAVTTWFPPSTTIQLNPNNSPPKNPSEAVQAPRPQSITIMGDRKYLIVPKHSILSVSPTIGAALNTPTTRPLTSPTADKAPTTVLCDKDKSAIDMDISMLGVPASASLGPAIPTDVITKQLSVEKETCAPVPSKCGQSENTDFIGTSSTPMSSDASNIIQDKWEEIVRPAELLKEWLQYITSILSFLNQNKIPIHILSNLKNNFIQFS